MSRSVVLALDQGSSSSRAIAFNERGRVVASARRPVRTFHPREGWFEHDALELAQSVERCCDDVLDALPKRAEIVAAGLACQRSTVVFWDKVTGKPAARAPSWQDGRAAQIADTLQGQRAHAHAVTGLYLTPYYSAPKIRWFLDNVPAVKKLADSGRLMIGPVSTWIIWRLTRGEVFAADPTMAQRMMLLDIATLKWNSGLLSFFGVPPQSLPEIRPSAGVWGSFKRRGRVIKLSAALGDQQAAALGLGAGAEGSSVANFGTGAFLLHNTGSESRRVPGLLTSVGWNEAGGAASYLLEGTVHAAGTSFDWLRDCLGVFKKSTELDALCRASRNRVWILPAIGGLGAPRWDYSTKTAVFGLSTQSRPADLARGVAEGIAFLLADIAAAMRSAGVELKDVRVSGGLSRLSYLMQFQADILGAPLHRCDGGEATAMGAAWLAAHHVGAPWADALSRPRVEQVFKPRMPAAEAQSLRAQWSKFVDAQAALSRDF